MRKELSGKVCLNEPIEVESLVVSEEGKMCETHFEKKGHKESQESGARVLGKPFWLGLGGIEMDLGRGNRCGRGSRQGMVLHSLPLGSLVRSTI